MSLLELDTRNKASNSRRNAEFLGLFWYAFEPGPDSVALRHLS